MWYLVLLLLYRKHCSASVFLGFTSERDPTHLSFVGSQTTPIKEMFSFESD